MTTYNGKNYSIEEENGTFTLIHPVGPDETYESFDELAEAHPVTEEAREFFFGNS
jgi:hypothetical protein